MPNSKGDAEKAMEVVDDDHEDVEEEEEDDDEVGAGSGTATAALLKNPAVMAALQGKLDSMVGAPSGYIEVRMLLRGWFLLARLYSF